jgi:predicted AAA+ superfamily ATPase
VLELLKSLIVDFQDGPVCAGIARRFAMDVIPGKVSVCIGVRRSGKSTYLFQLIQRLLDEGVARENILYLNFFDDRLHSLRAENLWEIIEAYDSLFPEKKGAEKIHIFFDEVQVIQGWEPFIDRLLRTENCQIYLTGSSAHMLSKEIATQMRGRALSWEMFPFSFREYLDFLNLEIPKNLPTRSRLLIQKAYTEYDQTGGFPEVLGLTANLRVKIHQEYFQAVLFRDLVERHDVAHPRAIIDLAHRLIDSTASLYTVNSLTGYLKSLEHKVPKASVSDYLAWFEDAYFLFTVRLYDASLARSNANPKKIYCVDSALARSVGSGILINSGHLLENMIFVALRRSHQEIYYGRTRTGLEVDFVVPQRGAPPMLVQVCQSLLDPKTRQREIRALTEAMAEQGQAFGTIVTSQEQESIEVAGGRIEITPAWKYLLQLS